MPYHQGSAVSVATVLTATAMIVVGYRAGRTHAAWKNVRTAKQAVRAGRRHAWRHTVVLLAGTVAVVATLLAAGFDLGR
jgi:archaellum component FlaF (FlaF/FlaG flagellin family)